MDYSISLSNNSIVIDSTNTNYEVTLARTGGQGSKGDSVVSAYVGVDNHLFIVIADGAGNIIEEIDAGNTLGSINIGLNELNDVAINILGEGYFLIYNATANRWESKAVKVKDLSDVEVTTYTENDVLLYNAVDSKFNNHKLTTAKISNIDETSRADGSILVYNSTTEKYVATAFSNSGGGGGSANDATITLTAGAGLTGGGAFTTDQAANETLTFAVDNTAISITESQISDLQAYLTAEADTLATVTGRGAITTDAISITNADTSTTTATGAFIVTGGVGIGENVNVGGNVIVAGNLIVNGTVNSNEVNIGDAVILLNSDEAGTPSQNAGFEVERGTSTNVSFVWDEAADAWDMGDNTLQNVIIDGGYY
jgi:hypothetical protein